jgi:hypothetical protein
MMKKMRMVMMIAAVAALAAGGLFAQSQPGGPGPVSDETTLSGSLTLADGCPALENAGTTYLLPGLMRFTGFIDGLKYGAKVTVKGYARSQSGWNRAPVGSPVFFRVVTLTLDGKDYEVARERNTKNIRRGSGFGPGPQRRFGRRGPCFGGYGYL